MRGILALFAALFSSHALAQDAPWAVLMDTTSVIDGRRTYLVTAKRGDLRISLGCDLGGVIVGFSFERPVLDASPRHAGAYRVGQSPPVRVTWDGGDATGGALFNGEAKAAMEAMFPAPVLHIRIGHEERSVDLHGITPFGAKVKEACGFR